LKQFIGGFVVGAVVGVVATTLCSGFAIGLFAATYFPLNLGFLAVGLAVGFLGGSWSFKRKAEVIKPSGKLYPLPSVSMAIDLAIRRAGKEFMAYARRTVRGGK